MAENISDSMAKGRRAIGAAHGMAKLTVADVLEIRRRHAAGEIIRVLAAEFGVSCSAVEKLYAGETWRRA